MTTLALTITPIRNGWAVTLTNGHQIARFSGPAARWRARRYLDTYVQRIGRDGR